MKKGETSATISSASKEKATVEDKGKKASYRIRIEMDFDPKTSKLRVQEAMDKYLASYGFRLNSGIKIEFTPTMLMFPRLRLKERVYMCILRFWNWGYGCR